MCSPGCIHHVAERLQRRQFFQGMGFVAAGVGMAATLAAPHVAVAQPRRFGRVVDLTHTLTPDFPTYFGEKQLTVTPKFTYAQHKFNLNEWTVNEHTGTHMDAPLHFSENGLSADRIPVANLFAPLAVIDIRAKAEGNADAQVAPEDIAAYERRHGAIPDGACVAMLSGWDRHASGAMFRNVGPDGKTMHFPGFHLEAAKYLMERRTVIGLAVDTLSLDFGPSPDFAVHYAWLPTNRWGLEALANLAELPPAGATIVVGGPKVAGASGGPSRVFALV